MAKITVTIPSGFEGDVLPAVKQAVANAMPSIAAFALDRITQYADEKLTTSSADYKRGFGPESLQTTETGFNIVPTSEIAEALEDGYDAYDMKKGLLASDNAKTSKEGGRYVDVPFRHSTKKNPGRMQGMPSDIKRLVKNSMARERRAAKKEDRPAATRSRVTGDLPRKKPHWKDLKFGDERAAVLVQHKTGKHSDMIRERHNRTTTYTTVRRISENSDENSWMHPGFQGVKAVPRVMDSLERTAVQVITMELGKIGLGVK